MGVLFRIPGKDVAEIRRTLGRASANAMISAQYNLMWATEANVAGLSLDVDQRDCVRVELQKSRNTLLGFFAPQTSWTLLDKTTVWDQIRPSKSE